MTRKGTFIALLALFVAIIGVMIGLIAYFNKKSPILYDEEDEEFDPEFCFNPEAEDFLEDDAAVQTEEPEDFAEKA